MKGLDVIASGLYFFVFAKTVTERSDILPKAYELRLEYEDGCPVPRAAVKRTITADRCVIHNAKDATALINQFYDTEKLFDEYIWIICLNVRNHVIGVLEVSHGGPVSAYLSECELFRKALIVGCVKIIVVHNHPSGDISPSEYDKKVYEKLNNLSPTIGIEVCDSMIVHGDTYYSFDENQSI